MALGQDSSGLQQVHGILLTIAWLFMQNFGIWSLYFKYTPYGLYSHAFFMSIIAFINAVAPMLMIANEGPSVILENYFHQTWGFVLYFFLPFLLISGTVCLISKFRPAIEPEQVRFRAIGHTIFGWALILLIKIPLLTGWKDYGEDPAGNILFGVVIAVEICSYSLYFYLKFYRAKIQQFPQQKLVQTQGLRSIKSRKDLKIYSNNFFIFANRVYNINQILATHPGGWEIIQSIKGREVDRFLYGVDPIEFYDVPRVSHSFNSIDLAGTPIAYLQIPRILTIPQYNEGQVSLITCHDKDLKIHTVHIEINHEKIKHSGYTNILQFGQYYSVSMKNKKTRLYTVVNFLQPENIKMIIKISNGSIQLNCKKVFSLNNQEIVQVDNNLKQDLIKNHQESKSMKITLLMKKYNDGQFTSQFLSINNQFLQVIISQPRGLGLSLDCITSNKIVLFAGGTGLFPFCDLIDLLFKSKLIEEGHQMSNILQQNDPVLKKKPFVNLTITLYIAVNELDELHPVTLYECNELSKTDRFKCHAKVKGFNLAKMKQKYSSIVLDSSQFEAIVDKHCKQDMETMFYMCGPVRFTRSIVNQLKKNNIPDSGYLLV